MRKFFPFILFIVLGFHAYSSIPKIGLGSGSPNIFQRLRDTLPNQVKNDTIPRAYEFDSPKEFTVDTIEVIGTKYLDNSLLVNISRLRPGIMVKLPGDEKITNAIKGLWAQGLFEDVRINAIRVHGDHLTLQLDLVERPRLGKYEFHGLTKSAEEDIRGKLKGTESRVLTKNLIANTERTIMRYFGDKGFLNAEVKFNSIQDPNVANKRILIVDIKQGKKARVDQINFTGNLHASSSKLKKFFKDTKQREFYKIFGSKKFVLSKYEDDKDNFSKKYADLGYRDAKIVKDSIIHNKDGNVTINIEVSEGKKYYFEL